MAVASPPQPFMITGVQFMSPQPKSFVLEEKIGLSMTSDSGKIYDEHGQKVFLIKGKHMTLHDSVWLRHVDGTNILGLKKKLLSLHATTNIVTPDERVVAVVKKAHVMQIKASASVYIGGDDSGQPLLAISGGFRAKNLTITHLPSGIVIAAVQRKQFTMKNIIFDQDTYNILIAPNVDIAFILMLCIVVDEMFNDENDSR
mmetsp:Transcript_565/g.1919  ORF Transcript_565/g.1919 Transcript_565/m.1919 type:complete len:201 (+) Transcript_565:106-708(+)|eukprot:CAMPEP_0198726764 /NCGR_PEP_ID=MMETSP1475-20131203/3715_1 /TAXON_ID= ORGANISM="Unidentified sp., Strain CCMP1999" /NCGR_SAMPLE_ID=MMETSP1475 /ASSEMBLY_ACC=CAM_ASM_001111 /LENGTH=200 /DNA_ID=CAMNT_0044488725 /DNA_START=90 /DNA_END=692 /DNA_ORIENTATION=+